MSLYPFNPNAGQVIQGTLPNTPTLDMGFLAHWSKTPAALSANAVHTAIALLVGAQVGYVGGTFHNPDVARNLSIVANDTDVIGTVTIHGTNLNGDAISEAFTINGTTTVNGNKAFATVTSVDLPGYTTDSSETLAIGYGNKLGLHHKLAHNTVLKTYINNVLEGTAPTVAVSATALESNTALLNTVLGSSHVVDLYYVV